MKSVPCEGGREVDGRTASDGQEPGESLPRVRESSRPARPETEALAGSRLLQKSNMSLEFQCQDQSIPLTPHVLQPAQVTQLKAIEH